MNIKITGSGSYIPTEIVSNIDFAKHVFLNDDGTPFPHPNNVVAQKFLEITLFLSLQVLYGKLTTINSHLFLKENLKLFLKNLI